MPVDRRFYRANGPYTATDLAGLCNAELIGAQEVQISDLAGADHALSSDLCFLDTPDAPLSAEAGACLIRPEHVEALGPHTVGLTTDQPRIAYAALAAQMFTPHAFSAGDAYRERYPHALISDTADIGENTIIEPGVVIGPGVQIGRNCRIGAHSGIYFSLIGDGVHIAAGVRIGEDGFGLAVSADGAIPMPHLGRVIIQDNVAIGANGTVDRGMLTDTIIGEGSKIDNLCQIAHNVVIGRGVIMAAFGGISGSVTIGDGVMLGGRVGVADHLDIGAGARLIPNSGHMRDVPPGETWGGAPAKPFKTFLRESAWLARQAAGRKGKRSE